MTIHIYGQNKASVRGYDKNGKYFEYKGAHYSGHRIAEDMSEAQAIIQDYLKRGWDVTIEAENGARA